MARPLLRVTPESPRQLLAASSPHPSTAKFFPRGGEHTALRLPQLKHVARRRADGGPNSESSQSSRGDVLKDDR